MPKKSHRVASRQAQLSQKKRKGKPQPYIPTQRSAPEASIEGAVETLPRPEPQPEAQAVASARLATRRERVAASVLGSHSYVWAELRRIGLVTVLISIILGVLTFILR